jgi:hypothetical protein
LRDYCRVFAINVQKKDDPVRLILNTKNSGVHQNLEQALSDAPGVVVAISDQDDIWEGEYANVLLCHLYITTRG